LPCEYWLRPFHLSLRRRWIVSASASNSKEATAGKLSPLEMSPFDLTLADDGRNVDAFVSGDQSPHSAFGFRPAWSTLRSLLQEHKREAANHRDVEEGRSRHEAA
jgi:hypothetical protein